MITSCALLPFRHAYSSDDFLQAFGHVVRSFDFAARCIGAGWSQRVLRHLRILRGIRDDKAIRDHLVEVVKQTRH